MNTEGIQLWVKNTKQHEVRLKLFLAVVALLAGLVTLFLIFWLSYAVIYIGWMGVSACSDMMFSKKLSMTHGWRLAGSGIFLILLFIQHLRTNPFYWGEYARRDYAAGRGLGRRAGMNGSLVMMLAYPGASANMVADILLVGPRLVTGSWNLWRESRQMAALDEESCASLLGFLAGRFGAVSYEELQEAEWESWLSRLRSIEGVVFLEKGLTLTDELRGRLNR